MRDVIWDGKLLYPTKEEFVELYHVNWDLFWLEYRLRDENYSVL